MSQKIKYLWLPDEERVNSSNMSMFMKNINHAYDKNIKDFFELHEWSVMHREEFWTEILSFFKVKTNIGIGPFLIPENQMPGTKFFPKGKINYAENMLRKNNDDIAVIFNSEDKIHKKLTWKKLNEEVRAISNFLKKIGIKKGDRVAAYLPNIPETVVVMLASASIGAVFSSASPDFGVEGVLDRFGQILPKIFITTNCYYYNGKEINITKKIEEIIEKLPSVADVLLISFIQNKKNNFKKRTSHYIEILEEYKTDELSFASLNYQDPLYIMYSSGTTGKPKCIVHCVGGVILKHLVELGLHSNAKNNSKVFYFTTCGWMMWNWLVSGLLFGSTICLYDGSPFYPNPYVLWKFADEEKINFFGVSAKYIDALSKQKLDILNKFKLNNLEIIGSTGSPLVHESFDYIYQHVKKNVHLASLSGGTDIVGCFVGGNPISPVFRGEIQGPILGMDVKVFNEKGDAIINQKGELVCVKSFPTIPIKFWNDENNENFQKAYFEKYENVWCHGDYVLKTENNGFIIYGRSDATLNPGGVRIGTAEIYRQVEQIEEVFEGLVVGQEWDGDTRILLFVILKDDMELTDNLRQKIRKKIRYGASPRHVPSQIIQVDDIPRTKSGKIAELAVKDIIHGKKVNNKNALANPECLKLFKNLPEIRV